MINPTPGRVVLVFPAGAAAIATNGTDPVPALIAAVFGPRMITVGGFDAQGDPFSLRSIPLLQDDDPVPITGPYAAWMPYQKGQAAKTEALEQAIAQFKVGDKVSFHAGPGRYVPAIVLSALAENGKVWYRLETADTILTCVRSNDVEPA